MKYRLLALDLDDTLLNKQHQLSENTITTINKLSQSGVNVLIATGRMLVSALPFIKKLDLKGPVITYNGAYIKDIGQDKVIYEKKIDYITAREIIIETEKAGLHLNLYQDDKLYVAEHNSLSRAYEKIAGIEAEAVGNLSDFISQGPTKLLIIEEDWEKKMEYLNYFKEKFQGKVEVTESKAKFIEIMAVDVSKGKALEYVAEELGVKQSEVIAIGDGWNDLEMIKWAGLGIAMGNAPGGVQEEADLLAPAHDHDGVAEVLKQIFSK